MQRTDPYSSASTSRLLPAVICFLTLMMSPVASSHVVDADAPPGSDLGYAIAIHGGAGTIEPGALDAETEAVIRAALGEALDAAEALLVSGGAALDAVIAAITVLEDSPHFNAGLGAVFDADGGHQLDAALMEGSTRKAGAVAGVRKVRHPILAARAVMDQSVHVMLAGDGADDFARVHGLEMVETDFFDTNRRRKQLDEARAVEGAPVLSRPALQDSRTQPRAGPEVENASAAKYFGTVGAVIRDRAGHLAAGTSTGGMTNKRWNRIGDSPVIGAGTWADSGCAVSATGWGEFFIRLAVAHDICARVAYRDDSISNAASAVIMNDVPELGGNGGVIAIDAAGNIAMPFNTTGMYRASVDRAGHRYIALYRDAAESPAASDSGSP